MSGGVISRARNWISVMVTALAVGTFLSGPCSALKGQAASLIGIVLEEGSERALTGVTLTMIEAQLEVVSDQSGRFTFPDLPPSQRTLRATLDGYVSVVFELDTSEISYVELRLPRLTAVLEELFAVVEGTSRAGYSEAEIRVDDGFSGATAADLLIYQVPGLRLPSVSEVGGGGSIRIRGEGSFLLSTTPAIYLDGVRLGLHDDGLLLLEGISATSVERIRILRGPAASARYPDSANGVILIETVHGRSGGTESAGND